MCTTVLTTPSFLLFLQKRVEAVPKSCTYLSMFRVPLVKRSPKTLSACRRRINLRRVVTAEREDDSSAVAEVVGVETETERGGVGEAPKRHLGLGMALGTVCSAANPQKLQAREGFGAALISSNSWCSLGVGKARDGVRLRSSLQCSPPTKGNIIIEGPKKAQ